MPPFFSSPALLAWWVLSLQSFVPVPGEEQVEPACADEAEPAGLSMVQTAQRQVGGRKPYLDPAKPLAAWVVHSWQRCASNCGMRQFREITCNTVLDGKPVEEKACFREKPPTQRDCTCGADGCRELDEGTCPEEEEPVDDWDEDKAMHDDRFVKVACLPNPGPEVPMKGGVQFDLSCVGWNETGKESVACHGGLPFWGLVQPKAHPKDCFWLCASRGLDLFGLEPAGDQARCRCGASALNTLIWNDQAPVPGLNVDPEAAAAARVARMPNPCPMTLYSYHGLYTKEGLPTPFTKNTYGKLQKNYVAEVLR